MRDSLIFISLLLFFFVFSYVVARYSKRESVLSTAFVFCVGVVIYFVLIPAEVWVKGQSVVYIAGYSLNVSKQFVFVFFQSFLAVPAFLTGLSVGGFKYYSLSDNEVLFSGVRYRHVFFAAMFMVLVLFFYADYIFLSSDDYFNSANLQYSDPLYSLLKYVAISLFCYYAVLLILARRLTVGVFLLLFVFAFGVFTNDKNPILMCLMAFACCVVRKVRSRVSSILLFWLMFPVVFSLLFLVRLFSLWRAGHSLLESVEMSFSDFSFASIDPAGPYVSLSKVFSLDGFEYGYTYIQNLVGVIPRAIYPSRPPDLSEEFAQKVILDWTEGRGLGFSPLAEAYMNFGYLAFFHFFLVGLVWALQWRVYGYIWRRFLPIEGFPVFYKVFGLYMLLLSFRGSSLHFIKIVPMYFFASLISIYIIHLLVRRFGEKSLGS